MPAPVARALDPAPIPLESPAGRICFDSLDQMRGVYDAVPPYHATLGPTRPKVPVRGYLIDGDGRKIGFNEQFGQGTNKLTLAAFWRPDCPECDQMIGELTALRAQRPDPRLVILTIVSGKRAPGGLPVLRDPGDRLQWQVRDWLSGENPPPFFAVLHEGSVVGHGRPGIDWRSDAALRIIDGELCRYDWPHDHP